jgi:hypothetical protein
MNDDSLTGSSGSQPAVGFTSLSAGLKCRGVLGSDEKFGDAKFVGRTVARSRMSAAANPDGGANALARTFAVVV